MALNDRNLIAVVCEATLGALAEFRNESAEDVRLIGVRSLRVFDTPVIAVQLAAPGREAERLLLGIAVADDHSR